MDKYEAKYNALLNIIGHPDNYTSEQLTEILSDPENREIYNILCKIDSAIETGKGINVAAEWKNFSEKHGLKSADKIAVESVRLVEKRSFWLSGCRAASIAAIIGTSIVAVAAGIAVTVAQIDHEPEPVADEVTGSPSVVMAMSTDSITTHNDSIKVALTPVIFENEPLEKIMKKVADTYSVKARFNNKDAASLYLYYKLDPTLPLEEIVSQLNTFEQINISFNGNTLNID